MPAIEMPSTVYLPGYITREKPHILASAFKSVLTFFLQSVFANYLRRCADLVLMAQRADLRVQFVRYPANI